MNRRRLPVNRAKAFTLGIAVAFYLVTFLVLIRWAVTGEAPSTFVIGIDAAVVASHLLYLALLSPIRLHRLPKYVCAIAVLALAPWCSHERVIRALHTWTRMARPY